MLLFCGLGSVAVLATWMEKQDLSTCLKNGSDVSLRRVAPVKVSIADGSSPRSRRTALAILGGKVFFCLRLDKRNPPEQNLNRRIKSETASAAPVQEHQPRRSLKSSEDIMSSAVVSTSAALGRPFVFDIQAD